MYTVDLYLRVRLACHVDGLSQREAASRFGIARSRAGVRDVQPSLGVIRGASSMPIGALTY